ncbi:hypothetical protein ACJBV0_10560, partial [Streptococcus suis]
QHNKHTTEKTLRGITFDKRINKAAGQSTITKEEKHPVNNSNPPKNETKKHVSQLFLNFIT